MLETLFPTFLSFLGSCIVMKKKIFILIGHPNTDETLNSTLAHAYEEGAKSAGHDVRLTYLGKIDFDPILHKGYREIQQLEPDLLTMQEDIRWADHIVIVHPVWWASTPALLQGLVDRMVIPGFAFRFTGKFTWQRLLKGKSGRIIMTSNGFPVITRLLFGDPTRALREGVLRFSGVSPLPVTRIFRSETMPEDRLEKLKKKVTRLGTHGR